MCCAVWEAGSGRCLRTVALGEPVRLVEWTPVGGLTLVAAAAGRRLLLLNPGGHVGAHRAAHATDLLLAEPPPAHDVRSQSSTSPLSPLTPPFSPAATHL